MPKSNISIVYLSSEYFGQSNGMYSEKDIILGENEALKLHFMENKSEEELLKKIGIKKKDLEEIIKKLEE